MCNPRRITATATRELQEAWQREVTRTARVSAQVVGEARVRQPLGDSISREALAALELALAEDDAWEELEDGGFRHRVEGGFVVYHPNEQELEIVAVREDRVEETGSATEDVDILLDRTLEAEGTGRYYDDRYGGHTPERAEEAANQQAEAELDRQQQRAVEEAGLEAEDAASGAVQARADEAARANLERTAAETRAQLEAQAREHLENVGLRCRQAFHRVLARGYRDALLAYARSQGAEVVTHRDDDGTLDLELRWSQ